MRVPPSRASWMAISAPMPLLAPVTQTTFPANAAGGKEGAEAVQLSVHDRTARSSLNAAMAAAARAEKPTYSEPQMTSVKCRV